MPMKFRIRYSAGWQLHEVRSRTTLRAGSQSPLASFWLHLSQGPRPRSTGRTTDTRFTTGGRFGKGKSLCFFWQIRLFFPSGIRHFTQIWFLSGSHNGFIYASTNAAFAVPLSHELFRPATNCFSIKVRGHAIYVHVLSGRFPHDRVYSSSCISS